MNNTAVIPPYTQYNFSSVKLHLYSRLQRFIFVNLLSLKLNRIIKDPFFIICNNILEKLIISLSLKKTCYNGYAALLSFLPEYEEPKCPSWSLFLFFFKWWPIVDCDVLGLNVNSQVLLYGLQFISSLDHLSMTYCQNKILKTSF